MRKFLVYSRWQVHYRKIKGHLANIRQDKGSGPRSPALAKGSRMYDKRQTTSQTPGFQVPFPSPPILKSRDTNINVSLPPLYEELHYNWNL